MREILLYAGSAVIFVWGVAHVVPTKSVVKSFNLAAVDKRLILTNGSVIFIHRCKNEYTAHEDLSNCKDSNGIDVHFRFVNLTPGTPAGTGDISMNQKWAVSKGTFMEDSVRFFIGFPLPYQVRDKFRGNDKSLLRQPLFTTKNY
jgi:hypothetical protein